MRGKNNKFVKSVAMILVICMVLMTLGCLVVLPFSSYGAETVSGQAESAIVSDSFASESSEQTETDSKSLTGAVASSARDIGTKYASVAAVQNTDGMLSGNILKSDGTKDGLDASMSIIQDIMLTIKEDYKDEISYDKLIEGAVTGIFDTLDDYSEFYGTVEDEEGFTDQLNPLYSGIGVSLEADGDKLIIISVTVGSPAESAGIEAGDVITAVDGKSTEGMSVSQLVSLLRGAEGTKVSVTLERKDAHYSVTIERAQLSDMTVYAGMIEDSDIGYMRIESFAMNTASDFEREKSILEKKGAKSLILDLRYNGGGYLDSAFLIANKLLAKGSIVYNLSQQGELLETLKSYEDGDASTPIVTLVNEYSASATEILAGALQDNNRAKLVGTKTFGKGIAQEIYSIRGTSSSFKLSTYYFTTPDNKTINGVGITPDHIVENYTLNDVSELTKEISSYAPMCENVKYYAAMTGLNVYGAQQRLEMLGYLTPTNMGNETEKDLLTAKMDERTVEAIKNFQSAEGLYPYGGLDYATRDALGRAVAERLSDASISGEDEDVQLMKGIELLKNT